MQRDSVADLTVHHSQIADNSKGVELDADVGKIYNLKYYNQNYDIHRCYDYYEKNVGYDVNHSIGIYYYDCGVRLLIADDLKNSNEDLRIIEHRKKKQYLVMKKSFFSIACNIR